MTKHFLSEIKETHSPSRLTTAALANDLRTYLANKMKRVRPGFPDCRDVFHQSDAVDLFNSNQFKNFNVTFF